MTKTSKRLDRMEQRIANLERLYLNGERHITASELAFQNHIDELFRNSSIPFWD